MRTLLLSSSLLALLLSVQNGATPLSPPSVRLSANPTGQSAMWRYAFKSLPEQVHGADAVVVARATNVAPGRVLQLRGGAPPMRFELVTFELDEILAAKADYRADFANGSFVLERHADEMSNGGVITKITMDGGAFHQRQQYVLFLKKQNVEPFAYLQINDEGRFDVTSTGLAAFANGPVASAVRGRSMQWLRQATRQSSTAH